MTLPVDKSDRRLSQCTLCTSSPNQFSVSSTRGELNEFGVGLFSFSSQNNFFPRLIFCPNPFKISSSNQLAQNSLQASENLNQHFRWNSDNIKQLIP